MGVRCAMKHHAVNTRVSSGDDYIALRGRCSREYACGCGLSREMQGQKKAMQTDGAAVSFKDQEYWSQVEAL
jgi:hypothetical protein